MPAQSTRPFWGLGRKAIEVFSDLIDSRNELVNFHLQTYVGGYSNLSDFLHPGHLVVAVASLDHRREQKIFPPFGERQLVVWNK